VVTALLLAICLAFVLVPIPEWRARPGQHCFYDRETHRDSRRGVVLGEAATVKDRQLENHLACRRSSSIRLRESAGRLPTGRQWRPRPWPAGSDRLSALHPRLLSGLWMRTGLIGLLSYLATIAVAIFTAFAGALAQVGRSKLARRRGHRLARRSVRERLGRPRWRPRESRPLAGVLALAVLLMAELRREQATAQHPTQGAIPAAQTAPAPLRWPDLGLAERVAINTAASSSASSSSSPAAWSQSRSPRDTSGSGTTGRL